MKLILIAACLAVCQAAKLNRGYLPPESASTAGGNGDILQTPFRSQGSMDKSLPTGLPAGSYVNEFEGVVIDAEAAGTRATHSGLGNSRVTYGSTDSKVGEAAFREANMNANNQEGTLKPENKVQGEVASAEFTVGHVNHHHVLPNVAGVRQPVFQPGDNQMPEAERFHAARDRTSNIIAYQNDIGINDFNYAYHTDNGISAGEVGMALDGVRSVGGYSYTGDDGQVYTISYTADEGGYRPQGSHLPTPPPIPAEILKALEQNAKDEAAGIVDDGSYDAKKYNTDHTKGNRPNDYNDKDKHNTFERRPVFNVISAINQNSQANKPNRDEDSQHNGQNQFSNVNLGYTVNDKQISNFSNIRNQYENEFDVLSNNKFNNNGPISNFKELGVVTQSSDNKRNQSQNVPLSQQKLQNENEVPDLLNGRPNSYQAPIAAIQNQQLNTQTAFQTQVQLSPSTHQSSGNRQNQKQNTINRPETSFVNSNNFQSRPNAYQSQTGLAQGQLNFNKKGTFFQAQSQHNVNAIQQSSSSGINSAQFNANDQHLTTANKPHNNFMITAFNNQAHIDSKPIPNTQTIPISYETTSTGVIQTQKPNLFPNPTQTRPTYNKPSISGTDQNQQPIAYQNNVFSNPITSQKTPTYYDAFNTGTIQKQQSIESLGSVFPNPTSTQVRPSSYDVSITGTIQKQQSIKDPGYRFSTPNPNKVEPISFDTSIGGTIQKQQQVGNLGNSFSYQTTTQSRPDSYYGGSISEKNQKQSPTSNFDLVFSNPTPINQQQLTSNSENSVFKPSPNEPRPTSTTANKDIITTGSSSSQQGTIHGFNTGFANAGQVQGELYDYPKPANNSENVRNDASTTKIQKPIVNTGNTLSGPSTILSRPNSYDASLFGMIPQQQQSNYNLANNDGYNLQNNLNINQQNQGSSSSGATVTQSINTGFQQVNNSSSSSASSNFASPEIESHVNAFDGQIKTENKPLALDTMTGRIQHHQTFNVVPTGNQFLNRESANRQNQQNINFGTTSTQFQHINSQPATEDKNNLHNSDSLTQFSSPIPANPNFGISHNFGSHSTSFNGEKDSENNKHLVAVSSSQSLNNDFQSNFLHKTISIRRQQQINQQAFSDFLHSKNVVNTPDLPLNVKNQLSASQPDFAFSNVNANNIAYQGSSPLQSISSSHLNEPYPTPQTFGVAGSDTKLFTAAPSRILSTPKEGTIEESQGSIGITQASISPFPSLAPSISKESGATFNSVSQTSNLPSQAIGSSFGVNLSQMKSQQANVGFNFGFDNTGSLVNIQNQGEIYEYPKPVPTKAPENPSANQNDNNRQIEIKNAGPNQFFDMVPTTQFFQTDNTKTESGTGPNPLPSRPNFISNGCCFSSQNKSSSNQNQSNEKNDSTGVSSESKTSTYQNAKEEFEGPKTQQTYDETGYHY